MSLYEVVRVYAYCFVAFACVGCLSGSLHMLLVFAHLSLIIGVCSVGVVFCFLEAFGAFWCTVAGRGDGGFVLCFVSCVLGCSFGYVVLCFESCCRPRCQFCVVSHFIFA